MTTDQFGVSSVQSSPGNCAQSIDLSQLRTVLVPHSVILRGRGALTQLLKLNCLNIVGGFVPPSVSQCRQFITSTDRYFLSPSLHCTRSINNRTLESNPLSDESKGLMVDYKATAATAFVLAPPHRTHKHNHSSLSSLYRGFL